MLTGLHSRLEPGQDQLETIPLLDLIHQLVDRELTLDLREQVLDRRLIAVDIEQTADDLRCSTRVDLLDVDLDELSETVAVQVEDEILDHVEPIADDDERKLI